MTEQDTEILDVKEQRTSLFGLIGHVLVVSKRKFDMEKASNGDRQKWARIIIEGTKAYAQLLETATLEDLEERIVKLEESQHEFKEHGKTSQNTGIY